MSNRNNYWYDTIYGNNNNNNYSNYSNNNYKWRNKQHDNSNEDINSAETSYDATMSSVTFQFDVPERREMNAVPVDEKEGRYVSVSVSNIDPGVWMNKKRKVTQQIYKRPRKLHTVKRKVLVSPVALAITRAAAAASKSASISTSPTSTSANTDTSTNLNQAVHPIDKKLMDKTKNPGVETTAGIRTSTDSSNNSSFQSNVYTTGTDHNTSTPNYDTGVKTDMNIIAQKATLTSTSTSTSSSIKSIKSVNECVTLRPKRLGPKRTFNTASTRKKRKIDLKTQLSKSIAKAMSGIKLYPQPQLQLQSLPPQKEHQVDTVTPSTISTPMTATTTHSNIVAVVTHKKQQDNTSKVPVVVLMKKETNQKDHNITPIRSPISNPIQTLTRRDEKLTTNWDTRRKDAGEEKETKIISSSSSQPLSNQLIAIDLSPQVVVLDGEDTRINRPIKVPIDNGTLEIQGRAVRTQIVRVGEEAEKIVREKRFLAGKCSKKDCIECRECRFSNIGTEFAGTKNVRSWHLETVPTALAQSKIPVTGSSSYTEEKAKLASVLYHQCQKEEAQDIIAASSSSSPQAPPRPTAIYISLQQLKEARAYALNAPPQQLSMKSSPNAIPNGGLTRQIMSKPISRRSTRGPQEYETIPSYSETNSCSTSIATGCGTDTDVSAEKASDPLDHPITKKEKNDAVGTAEAVTVPVAVAVAVDTPAGTYEWSEVSFVQQEDINKDILDKPIIPKELKASNLILSEGFILQTIPRYESINKINRLEDFLLDEISKPTTTTEGLISPFPLTRTITRMLIDAMGFRLSSRGGDSVEIYPISKNKKQKQTIGSVRTYIVEILDQRDDNEEGIICVMQEVALAFRLACHFVLSASSAPSSNNHNRVKQSKKRKLENKSELLRRALFTLLICLRGLLARLIDKVVKYGTSRKGNKTMHSIRSFFTVHDDSFSAAQQLLLDVVPLLTDMDTMHGILGNKKSIHILQHLVKLEKSFRSLNQSTADQLENGTIKGMMEMFMRQLLHQEGTGVDCAPLKKELEYCRCKLSSSGTLACTLPSMTPSCNQVIANMITIRREAIHAMPKGLTPRAQEERKFAKVTPETASSTSYSTDYTGTEDEIWDGHIATKKREEYSRLRIDGCIYLSNILDLLKSEKEDKVMEAKRLQILKTVYFLFHLLWDNDPFPHDSCQAKSLRKRDNLKSAAVACLLLAGKILDRPVSLRRLLLLAKRVSFPDSNILDTKFSLPGETPCFHRKSCGEPEPVLIKDYETHLLLYSFGCIAPDFKDFCPLPHVELVAKRLDIDATTKYYFQNTFNHIGYTHTPLSVLEDAMLVALGVYHFSCENAGIPLAANWYTVLDSEEKRIAESLSSHMSKTLLYVIQRRKQIEQLHEMSNSFSSLILVPNVMKEDLPDFESLVEAMNSPQ